MSKLVDGQPAYVLHRRPYRETSFIIEIFTPQYGRLSVIAKGVRKARSPAQGLLQPFHPLLVSWRGKSELMTLVSQDSQGQPRYLQGECLYAGFYLNELLLALLQKWDPHPFLYVAYEQTIAALQGSSLKERDLRIFEKRLLDELGYGILSVSDRSLEQTLNAARYYRFIPEQGFVQSELDMVDQHSDSLFSGKSLLAIAREDWQDEEVLRDAKRLSRIVLAPLLGTKSINSRKLFVKQEEPA